MTLESSIETLDEEVRAHLRDSADRTLRQRFAAAWKASKALQDVVKLLDAEVSGLQEPLQEEFLAEDVERVRIAGVTVYMERALWAGRAEDTKGGELAATLEELGLEQFLTVNSSTISSYVRELARAATGEDHPSAEAALAALPKPLQTLLKVDERVTIRGRRTG